MGTKPLPADTRTRLRKLIPLLGSNQPGEVQAAVAAIGRALTEAACDWHDLTAALTGTGNVVVPAPQYRSQRPKSSWRDEPHYNDDGYVSRPKDEVLREANIIHSSGVKLSVTELVFVNDMLHRANKYAKVGFTAKQKTWWGNIYGRACTHAAQAANTP